MRFTDYPIRLDHNGYLAQTQHLSPSATGQGQSYSLVTSCKLLTCTWRCLFNLVSLFHLKYFLINLGYKHITIPNWHYTCRKTRKLRYLLSTHVYKYKKVTFTHKLKISKHGMFNLINIIFSVFLNHENIRNKHFLFIKVSHTATVIE